MADLSCTFLTFRSPCTNTLHLITGHNFSTTSFAAHSFTSTFRKRNWKPLLCKPAVDVISTHEHSDGSLVFRFGDPSKVVENVELEKRVNVVEESGYEGVEDSGVGKDLDGDNENEVAVEIEVNGSSLTEVGDESDVEKPLIKIESGGGLESSVVLDLDDDRESEVMVDKVERELNGSSLTQVLDESDLVDLEGVEVENEGVIKSNSVEDLDGDRENVVMVDKTESEVTGSSLREVSNESDPVALDKPVILEEETVSKGVIESSAVEELDGDRENGDMVKEAEKEVNGSGYTALTDEFDPVELGTPVTVDKEIESDGMGQSSVDKVLDGDHESVATLNEADRDLNLSSLTELSDEFNLEGGSESSGSEEELPVPVLNVEVEVSSSPEPHIQKIGYDQEVLIEDLILENVAVADEIPEIENSNVTEELPGKNIGNATTLQPNQSEPENNISQFSTGITVTVDDLSVSEHQRIDAESHNGTITSEDSTSCSELAENSTDVSVDSVEAEPQDEVSEVSEDGIEIDSSEVLSNSSNLQVDVSLSEEAKCDTSEVTVQTVEVGNECESYANDIAVESPQLEANITDTGAPTSEIGNETTNETVKDGSEIDVMQFTSMSPQLETESQSEISEDGREIGSSASLSNSPDPQVEASLSEVAESQISEVLLQSVLTGNEKEIYGIDIVSSSTQSEAGINFSIETDTRTSEKEIAESESGMIQFTPISPQLEAESQLDEEMADGTVEEFKEDVVTGSDDDMIQLTLVPETGSDSLEALQNDEVESQPMTNVVPQDVVLETDRINVEDNLQISQLPVASGNEVVESETTEYARISEEIATDFVLSSGAAALPHPTKVLTGGEDAYFVTGNTWLGVADGVLQWSLDGNNSGVYAQDLIRNCEKLTSDCKGSSIRYPLDLLKSSVAETLSSGCSTVLLARFDGQVLHVANVGDSGFIILRHGTVYKRSLPMLHAFHLPLQIERDDDPSLLAELYHVDLEEDDVIVTATDGLFDNLYDQEISSIVFKCLATDLKLEEIAVLLATKAQEVGGSTYSRSPFADSAQAAGYVGYTGGKLDDVTVIVSVVQKRSTSLSY